MAGCCCGGITWLMRPTCSLRQPWLHAWHRWRTHGWGFYHFLLFVSRLFVSSPTQAHQQQFLRAKVSQKRSLDCFLVLSLTWATHSSWPLLVGVSKNLLHYSPYIVEYQTLHLFLWQFIKRKKEASDNSKTFKSIMGSLCSINFPPFPRNIKTLCPCYENNIYYKLQYPQEGKFEMQNKQTNNLYIVTRCALN